MNKTQEKQLLRHVSLRQLQIFHAIIRLGSFTRAAKELYITQPTASMQIKKLERSVGFPLFEQVGKQNYLTEAGKIIRIHTQQILDALANMEMEIADMQGLKTGHLRLAVVTTAKYFAPRALGKFCELYPGVDVSLKVTNRERLLQRLEDNADDLYILGHPPKSNDVIFEPYLDNPLVVLAKQNHPLDGKVDIPPKHLAKYPFIMREPGSGTRMATEDFFTQHKIELNIRMELGSNEAIKHAIDAGLGISVLSIHTLNLEGVKGPLVSLDVKGFPLSWQWHVGYKKGKHLSVIAKTFLNFIKTESDSIMRS
jgi:DNA-binding transcriptional LysR family regulator